jgi:hypothetical protein
MNQPSTLSILFKVAKTRRVFLLQPWTQFYKHILIHYLIENGLYEKRKQCP